MFAPATSAGEPEVYVGFWIVALITVAINVTAAVIAPKPNFTNRGPRLSDLRLISSAYGQTVPLLFGKYRLPGNIIWSTGLEEVEHRETSGGKGGGGETTTITYEYYSTFALALCEGEINDVTRIWGDGKLIYEKKDITESFDLANAILGFFYTKAEGQKDNVAFTVYPGSESQLPDPDIQADQGTDIPAFRGLAYILFYRLPLKDFGNRVPNITVETIRDPNYGSVWGDAGRRPAILGTPLRPTPYGWNDFFGSGVFNPIHWNRQLCMAMNTSSDKGLRLWDLITMRETRHITASDSRNVATQFDENDAYGSNGAFTHDGGFVTMVSATGGGNAQPMAYLAPGSYKEQYRFGLPGVGSVPSWDPQQLPAAYDVQTFRCGGAFNNREFVAHHGWVGTRVSLLTVPELEYVWDSYNHVSLISTRKATETQAGFAVGNKRATGNTGNVGVVFVVQSGSTTMSIVSVIVDATTATFDLDTEEVAGVQEVLVRDFVPSDFIPGATNFSAGLSGRAPQYIKPNDELLLFVWVDSVYLLCKLDATDGTIKWQTTINSSAYPVSMSLGRMNSRMERSRNIFERGTNPTHYGWSGTLGASVVDLETGELLHTDFSFDNGAGYPGSGNSYDSPTNSMVGNITYNTGGAGLGRYYFDNGPAAGVTVGSIVKDLSVRVGLTLADIDTTDIDADPIPGYVLFQDDSIRGAIAPLATAYRFDGIESDYKLKFVKRGRAVERTLTQDELTWLDEFKGEYFVNTRIQELELPEKSAVFYVDIDNDYLDGYQSAKRIKTPDPSMFSNGGMEFSIDAALEPTFAKQLAETLLYTVWQERNQQIWNSSWEHIDLDPTDRITLSMDSGDVFEPRLVMADTGLNLTIEFSGVSEDSSTFASGAVGDGGSGVPDQNLPGPNLTKLFLLDVPILRDTDEPPSRAINTFYYMMSGYADSAFSPSSLYFSTDEYTYTVIGRGTSPATWGTVLGTLPDPESNNPFSSDESSTLTVSMFVGGQNLSSITQLEMLNRANAAAVIKANNEVEIIQFRDVTQNANGTYTLTGLLRGRRGTDTMAFGHGPSEDFLLLDIASGGTFTLAQGIMDTTTYYKAVNPAVTLEAADARAENFTGRALMPYAPVHFSASIVTGGIYTSWVRRTRFGGPLLQLSGNVPLNEDTEEYEVDYLHEIDGDIRFTATGLTAPNYTITTAELEANFGDIGAQAMTIVNPNAEIAPGAEWTNVQGTLTRASSLPTPPEGSYAFRSGTVPAAGVVSIAYQDISVTAGNYAKTDLGTSNISLRWWQSRWLTGHFGKMEIEFLDGSNAVLATATSDYDSATGIFREISSLVPALTRTFRIYMMGFSTSTTNYVAFDLITLDHDIPQDFIRGTWTPSFVNRLWEQGLNGWVGDGTVVVSTAITPYVGNFHLASGSAASAEAYQEFAIPSWMTSTVDAGECTAFATAYANSSSPTDTDYSSIELDFLDSGKSLISTGLMYEGDLQDHDTWTQIENTSDIPANTRYIRWKAVFTRVNGTPLDAYLDDPALFVRYKSAIPTKLVARPYQISAQTGRGFYYEARANFTPIIDRYFSSVVLLLGFDGADGATTSTDSSPSAHTLVFEADAQLDTDQSNWGVSSLLVDGTLDAVTVANHVDFNFGSGEFTAECHIRPGSGGTTQHILGVWSSIPGSKEWGLYSAGGALRFSWSTTGSNTVTMSAGSLSAGTWYHIAVDKDSAGKLRLYLDGVMIDFDATNPTLFASAVDLHIGDQHGTSSPYTGHIDGVRVTKGVARYADDAGFTPPSIPYPGL
jgi:hypothetical protein